MQYIFFLRLIIVIYLLSTLFQLAAVFQFHRINQHPLHFSYITFSIIAFLLLPPPNIDSEFSNKCCYDIGRNNDEGRGRIWDMWDKEDLPNDTLKEDSLRNRYV